MKRWVIAAVAALGAFCGAQAQAQQSPGCGKDTVRVSNFHDVGRELKQVDWWRTGTTFAISSGLKLVVDHTLKHTVNELRPDGSDRHSFPSRHSSWAYGLAGFVTYNLAPYSPWWGVGAHFAANCVGMQRVMARQHFPHDVMGGVAVAGVTASVSQLVGNWIFGYKNPFPCWRQCVNGASQSITCSTSMAFPFQRRFGDWFLGNSLVSDVRYALPVSSVVLLTARGSVQSALVKRAGEESQSSLNALGLNLGAMARFNPGSGPFAFGLKADVGYRHVNASKVLMAGKGSLAGNVGAEWTLMLTRSFSVGLDASYGVYGLSIGGHRRIVGEASVGFLSRAAF